MSGRVTSATRCLVVGITLALLTVGRSAPALASAAPMGLFATIEIRSDDLAPFRKWRDTLARAAAERRSERDGGCGASGRKTCPYADWLSYLDRLRDLDRRRQMTRVNAYINRFKYVSDATNWGVTDYWQSPGEFLLHDGDCEDFAIIKYLSLRELGWRDEDLRLVTVIDVLARRAHAVTVAFADGRSWLLDNVSSRVVDTRTVDRYRPVFSLNARAWWHHRMPE